LRLAPCALIVIFYFFYLLYRVALRLAPLSLFRLVIVSEAQKKTRSLDLVYWFYIIRCIRRATVDQHPRAFQIE
jgi:hypothetical protein